MKINCGPTESEKLDIAQRVCREMEKKWFSWFAWFPVRVADGDCRWLEIVERQPRYSNLYKYSCHYPKFAYWKYRAKTKA
jgi:hypothetical protein